MATISDIVKTVASQTGASQSATRPVVNTVFDAILGKLSEGEDVSIAGFGKFTLKTRAARTARNPQTGAPVQVPERTVVKFTPAKALKDSI